MFLEYNIIFVTELIGTIAFAVSGAMVGIKNKMDIFGVCVLGVCTACGGGMVRDIVLGNVPSALLTPSYVIISIVTSLIVFFTLYFNENIGKNKFKNQYYRLMFLMDSLGLGIFTVIGIDTGMANGYEENIFLLLFLGTLTGVGGGLIRDVVANNTPYILSEDIYAIASIIGGIAYVVLNKILGISSPIYITIIIVFMIRYIADLKKWKLPRVKLMYN